MLKNLFKKSEKLGNNSALNSIIAIDSNNEIKKESQEIINEHQQLKNIITSLSVIFILIGIGFYYKYTNEISINAKQIEYSQELGKLSEKIQNNSSQALLGEETAFNEIAKSKDKISYTLNLLNSGGTVDGIELPSFASTGAKNSDTESLTKAKKSFSEISPYIDTIVKNKSSLFELKNNITNLDKEKIAIKTTSAAFIFQQSVNQKENEISKKYANEIVFLSQRIDSNIKKLLNIKGFSISDNFTLKRDVNDLTYFINAFKNGNDTLDVKAITDLTTLNQLNELEKFANSYTSVALKASANLSNYILLQETSRAVVNSSMIIDNESETIKNYFINKVTDYNQDRSISFVSMGLFALFGLWYLYLLRKEGFILKERAEKFKNAMANIDSVKQLTDDISPLSNGNLTMKISTTDLVVVGIANTIESVRQSLVSLVKGIKNSTNAVTNSSLETNNLSTQLKESSDAQYVKIELVIKEVGAITSDMDQVAQDTWVAQEEANKSKNASIDGEDIVEKSIEKMNIIRDTIQDSAKKIKRVGESSQAIIEVTNLIRDITKEINVLALNAAINAANTGDKTSAIVAKEVQRLANDSSEASKKIEFLIDNMQQDTQSAVIAMEKTTQEVVEGTKLSDTAGQKLKEIRTVSDKLSTMMNQVASKIEEKSSEMVQISIDMSAIKNTSKNNLEIVNKVTEQTEENKKSVTKLENSVAQFTVNVS